VTAEISDPRDTADGTVCPVCYVPDRVVPAGAGMDDVRCVNGHPWTHDYPPADGADLLAAIASFNRAHAACLAAGSCANAGEACPGTSHTSAG
jgi:hypothetical protein